MKIAFVYDAIYPYIKGGAEKRYYEIAKELTKKGHQIHFFGMKFWKGKNTIKKEGIYYHGICKPLKLYTGKNGQRSIKQAILFATKLYFPLKKEKLDLIECSNFPYFPIFTCKLIAKINKTLFFVTWHEVWGKYWFDYLGWKGFFGFLIEKIAAKLSKKNIVVSKDTQNKLYKINKNQSYLIPNGLDLKEIKKIKPSKKKFDILFAGRLIKEKNVDLLIDAVGTKYKVGVIGEGPEFKRLRKKAPKNFEFFGFLKNVDDVYALMKSAKVFAFPSLREGFGISVIEANACGLPVVVVNVPNNASKNLINVGVNGYVSKNEPKEYLNNIELTIKKINKTNCKKIVQKYDWEKIVNWLEEVYQK